MASASTATRWWAQPQTEAAPAGAAPKEALQARAPTWQKEMGWVPEGSTPSDRFNHHLGSDISCWFFGMQNGTLLN